MSILETRNLPEDHGPSIYDLRAALRAAVTQHWTKPEKIEYIAGKNVFEVRLRMEVQARLDLYAPVFAERLPAGLRLVAQVEHIFYSYLIIGRA